MSFDEEESILSGAVEGSEVSPALKRESGGPRGDDDCRGAKEGVLLLVGMVNLSSSYPQARSRPCSVQFESEGAIDGAV